MAEFTYNFFLHLEPNAPHSVMAQNEAYGTYDDSGTDNTFEIGDTVSLTPGIGTYKGHTTLNGVQFAVFSSSESAASWIAVGSVRDPFDFDASGQTAVVLAEPFVTCFTRGTLIDTPLGAFAVEDLAVGDMVITKDHGPQPIRWIGSKRLSAAVLTFQPKLRPIRIQAGALGGDKPTRDLIVSPQHRVLVRSRVALKMFGAQEVLVAAKQLLQLEGIDIAETMDEVEYFHFLFDRHEIVTSNGAESESLFTGPEALKAIGENSREEILALFPELAKADRVIEAARLLPNGRQSRRLVIRHRQHGRGLVG